MVNPFYYGLATVYVKSGLSLGHLWAWRITRLVHALPFLLFAAVFGWVDGWIFGVTSPMFTAGLVFGIVATGMAISWFKEWRRGY